jgi:peptidoglycan/LPS O-acetylase OafA/YrhL
MNELPAARAYYPALDGLRGIAILLVVISHHFGFIPFFPNLGNYGVDIFFVLSGFLITDILLRSKGQRNYFSRFYYHRVLRIFPVYYLVLIIYYLTAPLTNATVFQYDYYSSHWPMVWFHLNNFLSVIYPNQADGRLFAHFWTLSLEEQFYFVWPLLVFCIPLNRKLLLIILFIIGITITARFFTWYHYREGYVYWSLVTNIRADSIAIGALLASLRYLYPSGYEKMFVRFFMVILSIHLAVILLKSFIAPAFPHFAVFGVSSFCAAAGLAVLYSIRPIAAKSLLSNTVLRFFGKISYGLYVYHFPVMILGSVYLAPLLAGGVAAKAVIGLTTLAVSIGISTISFYYFEKKILQLKSYRIAGKTGRR